MTSPRTGYGYLDRRLDPPGSVLAMAHRGGAGHPDNEGFENTVRAFAHAVDLGYEYLETDVHTTKDGVLVVFHDPVLDRVTDGHGAIVDHTWDELAELRIGGTEPIPRLEDLLDAFPTARFNIDLKEPGAVEPMAALATRTAGSGRFCIGAFHEGVIRSFRKLAGSSTPTAMGRTSSAIQALVPGGSRLLWLMRDAGAVFQVPHFYRGVRVVDRGFVEAAHSHGKHVHVWTVDDPDEIEELIGLGVDGIFTDRTDVLKQVLIARGEWREPHGTGG